MLPGLNLFIVKEYTKVSPNLKSSHLKNAYGSTMSDRSVFKLEFSNFPVWGSYLTSLDLNFSSENENKNS